MLTVVHGKFMAKHSWWLFCMDSYKENVTELSRWLALGGSLLVGTGFSCVCSPYCMCVHMHKKYLCAESAARPEPASRTGGLQNGVLTGHSATPPPHSHRSQEQVTFNTRMLHHKPRRHICILSRPLSLVSGLVTVFSMCRVFLPRSLRQVTLGTMCSWCLKSFWWMCSLCDFISMYEHSFISIQFSFLYPWKFCKYAACVGVCVWILL